MFIVISENALKLYETLAADIAGQIAQGVIREGERIPSERQTSQHHNLSVSTVIRAFLLLESQGVIESRPQSGYFVRRRPPGTALPATALLLPAPAEVARAPSLDISALVLTTLRSIDQGSVPFGSAYPDPALFPWTRLNHCATSIGRRGGGRMPLSDLPPGNPELIRQIARRHLDNGLAVDASEIIVTAGATEAINLCLQAVAQDMTLLRELGCDQAQGYLVARPMPAEAMPGWHLDRLRASTHAPALRQEATQGRVLQLRRPASSAAPGAGRKR